MNDSIRLPRAARTSLAAALAALLALPLGAAPARGATAAEPGPVSTVSAGLAAGGPDNRRFGEYTGLDAAGTYGLLDVDINRLDRGDGTWLRLEGRDLGLDTRELRFERTRQGDWGVTLEYRRIPHNTPYSIYTGLTGIGSAQATINAVTPGTGRLVRLSTNRDVVQVTARKNLPDHVDVKVTFRNEDKDGGRMYGRTGIEFLVDPIDYAMRQWEAIVSYGGDRLQLSGGYYGTAFQNKHNGLVVDGVTDGNNSTYSPIGLPPDNVSHQVWVSGGYDFTPTTRGSFKASYGKATQDDPFISTVTVAPGVGGDLNGVIRTLRAEAGVSARPTPDLTLEGRFRHENRDDDTPVLVYYTGASATSRTDGRNEPRDIRTTAGTVEAGYRLPLEMRLTGGVDYEETGRNYSAVRAVSARSETHETTQRLELRRAMSDKVNGAISYRHAERNGTPFLLTVLNGGGTGANSIAPVHYADRLRDAARVTLDLMPAERVSLQVVADVAQDDYDSRTSQQLGVRKGSWRHLAVDGAVQVSRTWQVTAFASRDRTTADQRSCDGLSSSGAPCDPVDLWRARLVNVGYAAGVGVEGQAGSKTKLKADVKTSYDTGEYRQFGTPVSPVSNLYYRTVTVTAGADRALNDHSGVALSTTYDRHETNDWAWVNWVYDDGTTVYQDMREEVVFVGARYYRTWQ